MEIIVNSHFLFIARSVLAKICKHFGSIPARYFHYRSAVEHRLSIKDRRSIHTRGAEDLIEKKKEIITE